MSTYPISIRFFSRLCLAEYFGSHLDNNISDSAPRVKCKVDKARAVSTATNVNIKNAISSPIMCSWNQLFSKNAKDIVRKNNSMKNKINNKLSLCNNIPINVNKIIVKM